MPTSFKSSDIFGSGPHTAVVGPMGSLLLSLLSQGGGTSGFSAAGSLALTVTIRGRLQPTATRPLADQLAEIEGYMTDPPTTGDLLLHDGRTYPDIAFTRFERTGPLDVGRTESQAYIATFTRLPR